MKLIVASLLGSILALAEPVQPLTSPNGAVSFQLSSDGGELRYRVTFRGKPVVEASAIGLTLDSAPIAKGSRIGESKPFQIDESYAWYGIKSRAIDRCNGLRIAVENPQLRMNYTIEVRDYDDGVAFRHLVPAGQTAGARIPDEATAFQTPEGSTFWFHGVEDHYEAQHVRKSTRSLAPGEWLAPPVLIRLPQDSGYAAITEGDLHGFSGMALQAGSSMKDAAVLHARLGHQVPASYPFRLRYPGDVERLSKPAAIEGAISTPWRIILVGADLQTLANSDIVHNVAPAPDARYFPKGIATDWIKPGRAVWSYLDGGERTVAGMLEFSKLAASLGFEYNVIEGFWAQWPEAELKSFVEESRKMGVGIFLWKHSKDLHTAAQRKAFFDLCRRNGVAGAKIDFFDHEHKEVIDLYTELLRGAAEAKVMLDFHGCNKPTGIERTWPNLIGMEGIRGMETRPPYAQHEVTLPFTRMLAGMADYTPMHFGARKFADTTWSHQIANAVMFPAPLLVYAAHPASIASNPAAALIRDIPSTWDETVVLPQSDIGEVAVIARRKGAAWFLAINNGTIEKTMKIPLAFLGKGGGNGAFSGTAVSDGPRAASVAVGRLEGLTAESELTVAMRSGGGYVARLEKQTAK